MKKTFLVLLIAICATANAQYTLLTDFTSNSAFTGVNPMNDQNLISVGGALYGMTAAGGINSMGVIFKIMPDGTGYTKLYDFTGFSNGGRPCGSLVSDGTFFYGMTWQGGTNGIGVVFKIMPDGTGYSKLLDFSGANGKWPCGSLVSDGTFLYGMTVEGGINDMGVVFKIMPDGTGY
ncbi:MAG TPA: choice-of-anchor tandem repeat GloVer-containing protein, partial [Bacteroidia bacterium]|nr:choice-of-anchor tandem repeat GloVer-containing protein [Bacteroidia bacterium]